ncbi:MAG: MFS transporter [Solirubrobacteraceae bacterium]
MAQPAAPRAVPAGGRAAGHVGAARAPLRPHARAARVARPVPDPLLRARRPVGLLFFAGFIAVFFILTQYLQLGLDYPAWKSGLSATPFAIGGALVASAGSRQVLRRGPKLVAFGLAMVLVGLAGVWLAVGAHPGHDVALWTALPLLIAGLGGGLVISPNLTLTLSQVPVERAGSAGGVLQTGQRIGSAIGIAVTGSVFYNQLASSHGDYASAFRRGIVSIAAFVAAALALVLADALTRDS